MKTALFILLSSLFVACSNPSSPNSGQNSTANRYGLNGKYVSEYGDTLSIADNSSSLTKSPQPVKVSPVIQDGNEFYIDWVNSPTLHTVFTFQVKDGNLAGNTKAYQNGAIVNGLPNVVFLKIE